MDEKEKAKQLVSKTQDVLGKHIFNGSFDIAQEVAKIIVEEIIKSHKDWATEQLEYEGFYEKVKSEIDLL